MRLLKHLFAPSSARLFPEETLHAITDAIAAGERGHTGELCFAVEPALHWRAVMAGVDAHTRAGEVFAQLRVWDTAANNGVLIYLLLADHRIEIVADRGLADRVSAEQWRGVCQLIEEGLRSGHPDTAVLRGVEAATALLAEHFPRDVAVADANELPDRPHLL